MIMYTYEDNCVTVDESGEIDLNNQENICNENVSKKPQLKQ